MEGVDDGDGDEVVLGEAEGNGVKACVEDRDGVGVSVEVGVGNCHKVRDRDRLGVAVGDAMLEKVEPVAVGDRMNEEACVAVFVAVCEDGSDGI